MFSYKNYKNEKISNFFIDIRLLIWYNSQMLCLQVQVFISKKNHKDDNIFIETVAPVIIRFI